MRINFSYRSPKNGAVCSCCNETIKRNIDYAVGFTGYRSKQGTIYLCPECVIEMNFLIIHSIFNSEVFSKPSSYTIKGKESNTEFQVIEGEINDKTFHKR